LAKQIRLGVIRVLTTSDKELLESHGRLIQEYLRDPQLEVLSTCIDGFPEGIHTEESEQNAIPSILEAGKSMIEDFNVTSLIVSCVADPGVKELQKEVEIPVVGAGAAGASLALLLGNPIGTLGISDTPPKAISTILQSSLVVHAKPDTVETTLDISTAIEDYIELARDLVINRGVETILLACTGLSTVRIAVLLEEMLNITVVDPIVSAGFMAYYSARGNSI